MTPFDDLGVDHVGFAVGDLAAATETFVNRYGFIVYAQSTQDRAPGRARRVALGTRDIRLVLSKANNLDHPAGAYVERHGDGVCGVALRTADATAAFTEAIRRGARTVAAPTEHDGIVTASILGFGDVVHTFVQRPPSASDRALPGMCPVAARTEQPASGLRGIDHIAVCVEAGQLDPLVHFYTHVLDFDMVFTERIMVGTQIMDSQVVQSRSGRVIFTILEPDESAEPGQIDQFLKDHGGAGVQHVAFVTDDIVADVGLLGANGIEFLHTPSAYYDLVPKRLKLTKYSVEQLRALAILVDQDQDGQLLQIFAQSAHPRGTLFFEVIERLGARTFGSGNIRALYTAVELQRASRVMGVRR